MTEPLPQDLNTLYDLVQAEHTALLGLLRRNQETFRANLMAFRADFDRCCDGPSRLVVLANWRQKLMKKDWWMQGARAGWHTNTELPLARAAALAYLACLFEHGEQSTEQKFVLFKAGSMAMVCRKRGH